MAVAPGDVFLASFRGICNNQRIIFTHTYQVTGVVAPPSDYDVALDIAMRLAATGLFNLETPYLNCLADNYQLEEIRAQKISPVRYRYASIARGTFGAYGDDSRTSNLNSVITMWAALAGRRYVANKHLGPIPEGAGVFTGGVVSVGYKASMDALLAKLLLGFTSNGGNVDLAPCIFHQPPLGGSSLIVDGVSQSTVRVMRRRTVGLGE